MALVSCKECNHQVSDLASSCPSCGAPMGALATPATIKRVDHNQGSGCLVVLLGLCFLFFFPVGTIVGILLIIVGCKISYKFVCSRCATTVEKKAQQCPACSARFS